MGNLKTGYRLRPVRIVHTNGYGHLPGYPSAVKGLSITKEFTFLNGVPHEPVDAANGRGGAWAVTHTNSGLRIAPSSWRLSRAQALALAERLGEFSTDWDQCKDSDALVRWAPAVKEYIDNFAEENGLNRAVKINGPQRHEDRAEDAAVIEAELATEATAEAAQEDAARDAAQQAEVAKDLPAYQPTVERKVEDAPPFRGEPDEEGRPAPPPGWEWAESGFDSYVVCPCGDEIEQDGKCPAGHVSFLRQWGFI